MQITNPFEADNGYLIVNLDNYSVDRIEIDSDNYGRPARWNKNSWNDDLIMGGKNIEDYRDRNCDSEIKDDNCTPSRIREICPCDFPKGKILNNDDNYKDYPDKDICKKCNRQNTCNNCCEKRDINVKKHNWGWNDIYKTKILLLKHIPAGRFYMGSPGDELGRGSEETLHEVIFSRPFYVGVFQITQWQFEKIMGYNPSAYKGDTHPVDSVSYDLIRGRNKGSRWPLQSEIDEESFLGKLNKKMKLNFDLPTEAQWEYVCRAGKDSAWNNGSDITDFLCCLHLDKLGIYLFSQYALSNSNKIEVSHHERVGMFKSNCAGLYDMHGNVREWCRDWIDGDLGNVSVMEPKGAEKGIFRVLRGGGWKNIADRCRCACRSGSSPDAASDDFGFRVILPDDAKLQSVQIQ